MVNVLVEEEVIVYDFVEEEEVVYDFVEEEEVHDVVEEEVYVAAFVEDEEGYEIVEEELYVGAYVDDEEEYMLVEEMTEDVELGQSARRQLVQSSYQSWKFNLRHLVHLYDSVKYSAVGSQVG